MERTHKEGIPTASGVAVSLFTGLLSGAGLGYVPQGPSRLKTALASFGLLLFFGLLGRSVLPERKLWRTNLAYLGGFMAMSMAALHAVAAFRGLHHGVPSWTVAVMAVSLLGSFIGLWKTKLLVP